MNNYTSRYLSETALIAARIDQAQIEKMIDILLETRAAGGRLFFLGVGGGAGNATHAVNDFRKIANMESYAPTDNVSELTARVNDEGWDTCFTRWLQWQPPAQGRHVVCALRRRRQSGEKCQREHCPGAGSRLEVGATHRRRGGT